MQVTFNIIDLLGGGQNYPNEIARKLHISPSQAQKWLLWLLKNKMIFRKKGDLRRVFYSINPSSQKLIGYRRFILESKLESSKAWKTLNRTCPCGIYGSFAQGTFDQNSDIDMWVYLPKGESSKIRPIIDALSKEFNRQINVVYLTKQYLKDLQQKDPEFFYRLKLQSFTERLEVFNVA